MSRAKLPLFSLLAVLLVLGGCQSEVEVSGEVFVATKGGNNVKLGDLKVKAIPTSKWEQHLQERYRRAEKTVAEKVEKAEPLRDSLEAIRSRLKRARERIEEAESSYQSAVGSSGSYSLPSPSQTDVLFTRVKAAFRETRFGEVIATIPSGEALTPVEEADEHYRVSHSGREGWVKKVAISSKEKYE